MTTTTTDRIEKQILLRAPHARVWRALTDSTAPARARRCRPGAGSPPRTREPPGGGASPRLLDVARRYLDEIDQRWDERLQALERHLEKMGD